MKFLGQRERSATARLSVKYAKNLSETAAVFGAKTKSEAKQFPGQFGRPFVGPDPGYYLRSAGEVVRATVEHDPMLLDLFSQAVALNDKTTARLNSPIVFVNKGDTVVQATDELAFVTGAINRVISAMDIRIKLEGKPLQQAIAVAEFCIRATDEGQPLYRKQVESPEVNDQAYWLDLRGELVSAPIELTIVNPQE